MYHGPDLNTSKDTEDIANKKQNRGCQIAGVSRLWVCESCEGAAPVARGRAHSQYWGHGADRGAYLKRIHKDGGYGDQEMSQGRWI